MPRCSSAATRAPPCPPPWRSGPASASASSPPAAWAACTGLARTTGAARQLPPDLLELSRHPVCVVAAGPKVVLDLAATAEELESLCVPVVGWRTLGDARLSTSPRAACGSSHRVDDAAGMAALLRHWQVLERCEGVLLCVRRRSRSTRPGRERPRRGAHRGARAAPLGQAPHPLPLAGARPRHGGAGARAANWPSSRANAGVAGGVAVALVDALSPRPPDAHPAATPDAPSSSPTRPRCRRSPRRLARQSPPSRSTPSRTVSRPPGAGVPAADLDAGGGLGGRSPSRSTCARSGRCWPRRRRSCSTARITIVRCLKRSTASSCQPSSTRWRQRGGSRRAGLGLSALVEEQFGVRLSKDFQRSDWGAPAAHGRAGELRRARHALPPAADAVLGAGAPGARPLGRGGAGVRPHRGGGAAAARVRPPRAGAR